MATNPYFTQLHTQRFSFIGSPQQRDGQGLKDQRFVNLYPEEIVSPMSDGKKYYLKKRPGLTNFVQVGNADETGRGIFYWLGLYYVVVGSELYRSGADGGFVPLIPLATSSGSCGFAAYLDDSGPLLFMCDGVNGYIIGPGVEGGYIVVNDANFPTPHIPSPVFLDGYLFLAASTTQTIHNSTLQDMQTWPEDGFIDAEMFPDTLQSLSKVQNYIAAIGTQSIEWLYDNANSTGSPLNRNAPAVSQFGTPAPLTVVQTEVELLMVGQTGNGGRTVWSINGFQPTEIASPPVREALDFEGDAIVSASANVIQCAGHKWYILNLISAQRTFVYDFDLQMWHEWTTGSGQACFNWIFCADAGNGQPVFLGYNGMTASLDSGVYTDGVTPITCSVTTVKLDFDTVMRKRIFRLSLVADGPDNDTPIPMEISWSDDDYNTFTSGTTLNLSGGYSTITQLGYTRRRAFQFIFDEPYPLRMESFEVDIVQEVRR